MKINRMHTKKLEEFINRAEDGCLAVDQWTSGSGRYTKPLALPPFVGKFERKNYKTTEIPARGTQERRAMEWFSKPENSRRKYVLVLDVEQFREFAFNAMLGKEI